MGQGAEKVFRQRRYTNGQRVCEKMLNTVSLQGNAVETRVSCPFPRTWISVPEVDGDKC